MNMHLTWEYYFKCSGNSFDSFWSQYLSDKHDILVILGKGFDPRMPIIFEKLADIGDTGNRDALLVPLGGQNSLVSRSTLQLVDENVERIRLCAARLNQRSKVICDHQAGDVSPIGVIRKLPKINELLEYDDVIIDVSALPRSYYFGIVKHLLDIVSTNEKGPNIHVAVSENPEVDNMILYEGLEQHAKPFPGFAAGVALRSLAHLPMVWFSVLGEGKEKYLRKIIDTYEVDEVCPILPILSRDPKRTDRLIEEYQELFQELQVDSGNIILASENNPFDIYRSIVHASIKFSKAFEPLGGCRIMLSPLSSKLLSLGVLLSAYELNTLKLDVGVVHAQTLNYGMSQAISYEDCKARCNLTSLWLRGECYV